MFFCPNCKSWNEIDESSESEYSEYLAGYIVCLCGYEGEAITSEDLINEHVKTQTPFYIGKNEEENFRNNCKQSHIRIQKGNFFAAYILKNKEIIGKIEKETVIEDFEFFKAKISPKKLKKLEALFEENESLFNDYGTKIIGLPDFIISSIKLDLPIWVEIKSGNAKQSPIQKTIKKELEHIGFKVLIYKGENFKLFIKNI